MAVLRYVGTPPQYDVQPTQGQDVVDQAYVAFLLSQNMTTGAVNAQITAGLAQYATVAQANTAMSGLATPAWIQTQVANYVPGTAVDQPNGPVSLGPESDLVPTSLITAPSTQTWPKPYYSPGTYPTAAVSATTTPVQLLSVAIPDPGYPYVLLCFGSFDTTVAADDGTSAQISVMQGNPTTGTLIAAGVGNSEFYTGPTPGDLTSQMFINSASGVGGTWTTVPNWLPQNGSGFTSTVLGNYLQVPDTMTATLSASITYSGAAGTGAKGAPAASVYVAIVDSAGNQLASNSSTAGGTTLTVSYTGSVVAGQLYGVQMDETSAGTYAKITAGTFTITPSQVPNTSSATILPVSFTNQLPITGPTNIYAMLESSNSSTQVTATTFDPGLWVTPIPWAGGNPATPVTFDAVGVGQYGGSAVASYSYNHTATVGAFVIVDVVVDRASAVSSVTYGGTAMTLMASALFPGATGNGTIYRYYLANVAAGTKLVAITLNAGAWCASCSYSYLNVIGFTYSTTSINSSLSLTQSVAATTGQMVVQSFGCQPTGPTSPAGGTLRFNHGSHAYLITQDSSVTATYTAAVTPAQGYGGIATVLLP